jgi:hypothetical protein
MYLRDTVPPYKPILESQTDTKHFPKEFTGMKLTPPEVEEVLHDHQGETGWKGFSYTEDRVEK